MANVKLTIYIPTYNRSSYLCDLLRNIRGQLDEYREDIQVVVSDNCSEDNTERVASKLCSDYSLEGFDFVYHRNETNIGSCRNFLQASDYSTGEFCWIMGDDDMILNGGINEVMKVIGESDNIDYYCINYAYIKMTERADYLIDKRLESQITKDQWFFKKEENQYLDGFGYLFTVPAEIPAHTGTFLGGNIIRTSVWHQLRDIIDFEKEAKTGINVHEEYKLSMDYVFPHLKIIAKAVMNKKIGYIGKTIVGLGVGDQENAGQNWRFIDSVVFEQLADWYEECGINAECNHAFLESFLPRCGINVAKLSAEDNSQFTQEDVVHYMKKYGAYEAFSKAFFEQLQFFMVKPSKARYDDFCSKIVAGTLQNAINSRKKIAIWGMGEIAEGMLLHCNNLKENVHVVVDGSRHKWGTASEIIPWKIIQSPEALQKEKVDIIIITSVEYAIEIRYQIRSMGIDAQVICANGIM